MNLSVRDITQGATLLVIIGMWIGGIDNLKQQTLLGIEALEEQSDENHKIVMAELMSQSSKINKIEAFLNKKYPQEYIPEPPRTQLINKW